MVLACFRFSRLQGFSAIVGIPRIPSHQNTITPPHLEQVDDVFILPKASCFNKYIAKTLAIHI